MVIKLNTTSIHHLFAENQNQKKKKKKKKKREAYSELNFSFKAQKYHIR